jgi:anti-sigma factor RsiW
MTCVECQERLQRLLDGWPSEAASAADHLAACPECNELHRAGRRLHEGLRFLSASPPPSGFADRIVAHVLTDRQARRSRRRRWLVVTALAASLLVAVSAGNYWFGKRDATSPPLQPAPIADSGEKMPDTLASAPSPRDNVAGAGQAVASLSRKATDETVEQTRLFWPVASSPLSFEGLDLQTPLEPSSHSLREAGQNVSSGLEPVANSARRAMNLFWRDLPPMEPSKKQGS